MTPNTLSREQADRLREIQDAAAAIRGDAVALIGAANVIREAADELLAGQARLRPRGVPREEH